MITEFTVRIVGFIMIVQANEKLAIVQQMNIARDVALGMEYLSALGFVHRVRIGIKLHSMR